MRIPPPSCTRVSWRWSLSHFNVVRVSSTSLAYTSEPEVVVVPFRHSSRVFHLPRVQERARGGSLSHFDAICVSSSPSHAGASRRWLLSLFDAVCVSFTSCARASRKVIVLIAVAICILLLTSLYLLCAHHHYGNSVSFSPNSDDQW
jgi:hypothetical protein